MGIRDPRSSLGDDFRFRLRDWQVKIISWLVSTQAGLLQWARKVYATVAENYANSKYYISGKRKAKKALFSSFDAAWAGVSHSKISAIKNV